MLKHNTTQFFDVMVLQYIIQYNRILWLGRVEHNVISYYYEYLFDQKCTIHLNQRSKV